MLNNPDYYLPPFIGAIVPLALNRQSYERLVADIASDWGITPFVCASNSSKSEALDLIDDGNEVLLVCRDARNHVLPYPTLRYFTKELLVSGRVFGDIILVTPSEESIDEVLEYFIAMSIDRKNDRAAIMSNLFECYIANYSTFCSTIGSGFRGVAQL
jgi:hypothetical protein